MICTFTVPPPAMRGRITAIPWPVPFRYVRWEVAPDSRVRPFHGLAPPPGDPFWGDARPPVTLGKFNCRGEYVVPREMPMSHRCATCGTKDGHMPGCAENEPPEDDLPDGLFEIDGVIMFRCLGCDRWVEWELELSDFDPDMAYGGCSQWCLP